MHCCPTEVLVHCFELLPYHSLLAATRVCRRWSTIIGTDPVLQTLLFRRPRFYRTGCDVVLNANQSSTPTDVELHPAFSKLTFYLGNDETDIGFRSMGPLRRMLFGSYLDCAIAFDHITIPSVQSVKLKIEPAREYKGVGAPLSIHVQNIDGVRVSDIFRAIVQECQVKCDLIAAASGGTFHQRLGALPRAMGIKAHLLGRKRYYAGLGNAVLRKGEMTAVIRTRGTYLG